MNLLSTWLRSYLPALPVDDRQLAEDLTLRGIAVEGAFAVPAPVGGSRFEMDITTNRVDAMNHYGVAREVATMYDLPLTPLAAHVPQAGVDERMPVHIEAQDLCGRFTARIVRNVTVAPSTGQLADYFDASGQKPISNAVDITNFVWLAMGHPTHVFDLDTIEGGIVVRRAKAGEKLVLLDGVERTLTPDDLVVADERKALGLAGVMGGWDSRVTETTKNILIEAAWFLPSAIRASSRRHGLHTDASHRFERGADFAAAPVANALVANLLAQYCSATPESALADVLVPELASATLDRAAVTLRVAEVHRHLGVTADGVPITAAEVARIVGSLGCRLTPAGDGAFTVELPSWRLDLEREIDLIEEIARVYGYNRFANTLPAFTGSVVELPHRRQEQAVRETLRALGFHEAISSTFVSAEDAQTCGHAGVVPMGNPLSAEAGFLRPALAASMANMVAENLHRDVAVVRLFELGTVFTGSIAAVQEDIGLALGLTGGAAATALHGAADALLFEAKGALETLLRRFDAAITFAGDGLPGWVQPGRGALVRLDGQPVGVFGELSAAESARRKLRAPCVLAELHASALYATALRAPRITELSRFQAVTRDFSFVFADSVRWQAIAAALTALEIAEMQTPVPLEIFRDAKGRAVAAGSYSLLLRTVFQSPTATLSEEQLTAWTEAITGALVGLGGVQRA